jgi:hypothetical protein
VRTRLRRQPSAIEICNCKWSRENVEDDDNDDDEEFEAVLSYSRDEMLRASASRDTLSIASHDNVTDANVNVVSEDTDAASTKHDKHKKRHSKLGDKLSRSVVGRLLHLRSNSGRKSESTTEASPKAARTPDQGQHIHQSRQYSHGGSITHASVAPTEITAVFASSPSDAGTAIDPNSPDIHTDAEINDSENTQGVSSDDEGLMHDGSRHKRNLSRLSNATVAMARETLLRARGSIRRQHDRMRRRKRASTCSQCGCLLPMESQEELNAARNMLANRINGEDEGGIILAYRSEIVALACCAIEADVLRSIHWRDLLNVSWNRAAPLNGKDSAASIRRLIERFNSVSVLCVITV